MILLGGFSTNMLDMPTTVSFELITQETTKELLCEDDFESAIAYYPFACVLSELLHMDIPCDRWEVKLQEGDCAIIAQYNGPKITGTTRELPARGNVQWTLVEVD